MCKMSMFFGDAFEHQGIFSTADGRTLALSVMNLPCACICAHVCACICAHVYVSSGLLIYNVLQDFAHQLYDDEAAATSTSKEQQGLI